MNAKSLFGIVLTIIGLVGLIYGGVDFTKGGVSQSSFVYVILGGVFFFAGIGLIRSTKA